MTTTGTVTDTPERGDTDREPIDDLPDPWAGIPATLLRGDRGYDTDSAGGCG